MSETLFLEEHIKRLYRAAELKNGVEYIYTLLLVTEPELPEPDPIIRPRNELGDDPASLSNEDVFWPGPLQIISSNEPAEAC